MSAHSVCWLYLANERLMGFHSKYLKAEEVQIPKNKISVDNCFYLRLGDEFSARNLDQ